MSLLEHITKSSHLEERLFTQLRANPRPVVLFGAGSVGRITLEHLEKWGISPVCFCDNDPAKQGTAYLGLPVFAYDVLKTHYDQYAILIAVANRSSIYKWLLAQGEPSENIVYLGDFRDPWSEKTDYGFIVDKQHELETAYNCLADELSRRTFINLLNYKLSGDPTLLESIKGKEQYFEKEIVHLTDDEIFVDVGACDGDTLRAFTQRTGGRFKRILALEPDDRNCENIDATIVECGLQNVDLVKKGAWDKDEIRCFVSDDRGSTGRVTDQPHQGAQIELTTIDRLLEKSAATFIKMDIEGAEKQAIEGARTTIEKGHPKLAISIYHKREDLFEILLQLKEMHSDYRFYIRNYTDVAGDTVLYAV